MKITEDNFGRLVQDPVVISPYVRKLILDNQYIVEKLKIEHNKFKVQYKQLGGDDWKGTKPKVFEIFESILGDKK